MSKLIKLIVAEDDLLEIVNSLHHNHRYYKILARAYQAALAVTPSAEPAQHWPYGIGVYGPANAEPSTSEIPDSSQTVEAVGRVMPYTGLEAAEMMRTVIDDIIQQSKGTHETAHQFVSWHLPRVRSLLTDIDAALAHPRPTGDHADLIGFLDDLRGRYAAAEDECACDFVTRTIRALSTPTVPDGYTLVWDSELAHLRDRNSVFLDADRGGYLWYWQGDGQDVPESLSCSVVMSASTLRTLIAKAAPAVEQAGEVVAWLYSWHDPLHEAERTVVADACEDRARKRAAEHGAAVIPLYAQPNPSTTEDSAAAAQPRPVGVPDDLTDPDNPWRRAVEHAGYLVTTINRYMEAKGEAHVAFEQVEGVEAPTDEAIAELESAQETEHELWGAMRNDVYEFTKRRDRAMATLAAAPAPAKAGGS